MQTGIDMYGQGRHPFFLEPAVIVAITDGGKLAYNGGIHEEVCNSFCLPTYNSNIEVLVLCDLNYSISFLYS